MTSDSEWALVNEDEDRSSAGGEEVEEEAGSSDIEFEGSLMHSTKLQEGQGEACSPG